jgi:N,N'-diacetyllegionaminate synthase
LKQREQVLQKPCYLIAEIGVNHAGDVELAKKMVLAAVQSGADAVKFQTFTAKELVTAGTPKVAYQLSTTSPEESHYRMIESLEFSRENHLPVINYCKELGVDFISTPYDVESARFLRDQGVTLFKTASADIVDYPLHSFLARNRLPVMISTGMATLGEIEQVLSVYQKYHHNDITLLHCVSNYPCSHDSLHMRAMKTLQDAFGFPVGFSDHSVDEYAAVMAVTLGATVIEKHFTLDKNMEGPDHKASSTPDEFRQLVHAVRTTERALGSPVKRVQAEEMQMRSVSRKSVVAVHDIVAGTMIREADLAARRPGTGITPFQIPALVGKRAARDIRGGSMLAMGDVEDS